jgi:7-cyano-7-deazaguanine synthase
MRDRLGGMTVRSLVLLSGGVDSAVVLADSVHRHGADQVGAVSFAYGQSHKRQELLSATVVASHYGVRHQVVNLGSVFGASALTGVGEIPDHHADAPDATEVPGRNLVLLSVAAAVADGLGCGRVAFGANAADAGGYPDCRPQFIEALREAIRLGTRNHVFLHAPLLYCSKAEVVSLGRRLGTPLELTWSCYRGGEEPCRSCGACAARSEAGL